MKTLIFGHRGAKAYCPENTLFSFETAINQGADGLELDVHYSKDGQIVVFHDFDLEELTGEKAMIYEKTWEELSQLEIKHDIKGKCIPTLEQVLKLIERKSKELNKPLYLNVEFKAGSQLYKGIEARAKALCEAYLPKENIIYSSFDHFALKEIKKLDPEAITGALTAEAMVDPWLYTKHIEADFYHPHYLALNEAVLKDYAEQGLRINPYTVNDPRICKGLIAAGVFGVITDCPDLMLSLFEKEA